MAIEDMAREDVVTAPPDATAQELARTMGRETVGSVVIVEDGTPTGIVTDRDLTLDVVADDLDPTERTARDVISGDLFTVESGAGIYEVLEEMRDTGVRRVPVVDDGEVAGIVTLDDMVVLLSSEMDNVADVIQGEAPPY